MKGCDISVLIPAYAEAENLKILLPELRNVLAEMNVLSEVLILAPTEAIDDTEEVCVSNGASYIVREGGDKYGDAIRTGLKHAKGEYVLVMDADGSHSPSFIPDMYKKSIETNADLTIGSRYVKGGKTANGFISRMMSKMVNGAFRLFFSIKAKDVSNSFRLYKRSSLENFNVECNNFDVVEELIVKMKVHKPELVVEEVPIVFNKRNKGKSKRKLFEFIKSYCKTISSLRKYKSEFENKQNESIAETNVDCNNVLLDSVDTDGVASAKQVVVSKAPAKTRSKTQSWIILILLIVGCFMLNSLAYLGYGMVLNKFENQLVSNDAAPHWKRLPKGLIEREVYIGESSKTRKLELTFKRDKQAKEEGFVTIELYNKASGELIFDTKFDVRILRDDYVTKIVIKDTSITSLDVKITTDTSNAFMVFAEGDNFKYYVRESPNPMPFGWFTALSLIVILPLFLMLFFKLNLFSVFKKGQHKISVVDILIAVGVIVFCAFSFGQWDLKVTGGHALLFNELLFSGKALQFYDYANDIYKFDAVYSMPTYIMFAIWSLPISIVNHVKGIDTLTFLGGATVENVNLFPYGTWMWLKLLPTIFFALTALVIYKIGVQLKMTNNNAKWVAFAFACCPLAMWSQFVYCQYDILSIFFIMLAILFCIKKRYVLFTIMATMSVMLKTYMFFVYIPILLLVEKRLLHLIKHFLIFVVPTLIFNMFFGYNKLFTYSDNFFIDMMNRLFFGINVGIGTVSFVLSFVFAACIYACFKKPKSENEVNFNLIYIPFAVLAVFLVSVRWNPQWLMLLSPFLALIIFMSKNKKELHLLSMLMFIGFIPLYVDWGQSWDGLLLDGWMQKFLPDVVWNPNKISLLHLFTLFGKLSVNVYVTLFAVAVIGIMILGYPTKNRIKYYEENVLAEDYSASRVYIYAKIMLLLVLYVLPCFLVYFTL